MKKSTIEKLQAITNEIPSEWKAKLMRVDYDMPVTRELIPKLLDDPEVSETFKKRVKNLLDAGHFDKMSEIMDEEMAKQIDNFVETRIMEEIEKGNLPKSNFKGLIRKIKQQQKDERKSTK